MDTTVNNRPQQSPFLGGGSTKQSIKRRSRVHFLEVAPRNSPQQSTDEYISWMWLHIKVYNSPQTSTFSGGGST